MKTVNYELESFDSLFDKASNHANLNSKRYFRYNLQLVPSNQFRLTIQPKQAQQNSSKHDQSYQNNQPIYTITAQYRDESILNSISFSEQRKPTHSLKMSDSILSREHGNSTCFSQLFEHPRFLFYIIFASSIIFPIHKAYKSVVKHTLSSFGLNAIWTKTHEFYIADIKAINEGCCYPVICHQDISEYENQESCRHNGVDYIQKIKNIKQKNAFRNCFKYFKTHLVNKLYEVHGQKISSEYQSIMKSITSAYNRLSCADRLAQINPYQTESKALREDGSYTLKALKHKIQIFLTDHREFYPQPISQLNNSFSPQELSQLFCAEYQSTLKNNQPISDEQQFIQCIYSTTLNRMRKHIQISDNSIALMQILIAHFFNLHSNKVLNVSKFSLSNSSRLVSMDQSRSDQLLLSPSSLHSQIQVKGDTQSVEQINNLKRQISELKSVIQKNKLTVPQTILKNSDVNLFSKKNTNGQNKECLLNLGSKTHNIGNPINMKTKYDDKYLKLKIQQLKQETSLGFDSSKKYIDTDWKQNYLIVQGGQDSYRSSIGTYIKQSKLIPQMRKNIKCNESKQNELSIQKQRAKSETDMSNLAHYKLKAKSNTNNIQIMNRSGSKNSGSQKLLWRI